ncbi:MAG: hypothetical protein AAGC65_05070, partial [Mucilaginibacter sp.]|uniref:hypothetical protein n=1 Tax=Mucilaginibacter sp. TaxID=1882438 RepID=UPI0031B29EF8
MKCLVLTLLASILLQISACKKDHAKPDTTLIGKWKLSRNKISSGGPMYWVKAANTTYAVFNTNGTLSGTTFPKFKQYTVKDSVTLTLTGDDTTKYQNDRYEIKGDSLNMSPSGPRIWSEGGRRQVG